MFRTNSDCETCRNYRREKGELLAFGSTWARDYDLDDCTEDEDEGENGECVNYEYASSDY